MRKSSEIVYGLDGVTWSDSRIGFRKPSEIEPLILSIPIRIGESIADRAVVESVIEIEAVDEESDSCHEEKRKPSPLSGAGGQ